MTAKLYTRYILASGRVRMNVLLDQPHLPRGTRVTLKDDTELGPDAGREWSVIERFETLEAMQAERVQRNRKWNNNI